MKENQGTPRPHQIVAIPCLIAKRISSTLLRSPFTSDHLDTCATFDMSVRALGPSGEVLSSKQRCRRYCHKTLTWRQDSVN